MKHIINILLLSLVFISCQQEKEASIENINQIYATKDFSIAFTMSDSKHIRMSFREDYVTYTINGTTDRKTLEYNEVVLINDFIKKQFSFHDPNRPDIPSINIYDDTRKVKLKVPQYASELRKLINSLGL